MDLDLKDKIFRTCSLALVSGVVVVGAFFLCRNFKLERSLRRQEAEVDQRLEEKRAEIRKLQENQRRFRSDREFVEFIARQNGRVFPGELVFRFPKD